MDYKYSTIPPNPRRHTPDCSFLTGHNIGYKKKTTILSMADKANRIKPLTVYKTYCSCKWQDATWWIHRTQCVTHYNMHILDAGNQLALFDTEDINEKESKNRPTHIGGSRSLYPRTDDRSRS